MGMTGPETQARTYRQRIRAWALYDWANSAFATTILASVLPVYYGTVAGSTLASPSVATTYWTTGLSVSLLIVAILSPILGTISDVVRGKKRFLAVFAGIGIVGTGLLVLVDTGDWLLASILFLVGRVGFAAANVFYDAMLPHVAKEEDRDRVSTYGYALGYLGGGALLVLNVAMIKLLPEHWGYRLSFLSVAVWWGVFSIPIFRRVPEPPAAGEPLAPGESVVRTGFKRLGRTFHHLRQYKELFKYLVAFLLYNDGIGTVIGVAAIYATEMRLGAMEVILAVLLVQFAGIPYSLLFGRIPSAGERRRSLYLSFVVFNLVALPLVGLTASQILPDDVTGARPPRFEDTATTVGEGRHLVSENGTVREGAWTLNAPAALGRGVEDAYAFAAGAGDTLTLRYHGCDVEVVHSLGPDHGIVAVEIDGAPLLDEEGRPVRLDGYRDMVRYGEAKVLAVPAAGEHVLVLRNTGERNGSSTGTRFGVAAVRVLPAVRESNLLAVLGVLLGLQVVAAAFALTAGRRLFASVAERMTTKRTILLSLVAYAGISGWGFGLDSVIGFYFLAWMVAVVQGGSQGLSRSLYAQMSPASMSGEFFGFFTVMSKFSAMLGPLLFGVVAMTFDSSRPAILSLVVFFLVGGVLLGRVDVEEGTRVAKEADAAGAV